MDVHTNLFSAEQKCSSLGFSFCISPIFFSFYPTLVKIVIGVRNSPNPQFISSCQQVSITRYNDSDRAVETDRELQQMCCAGILC